MFEDFNWNDENEGFGGELIIWGEKTKTYVRLSDEENPYDKKAMLSYQVDIVKKLNLLEKSKAKVAEVILGNDYVCETYPKITSDEHGAEWYSYPEVTVESIKEYCDEMHISVCFIETSTEGIEIYMIVRAAGAIADEFGISIDAYNGVECEGLV